MQLTPVLMHPRGMYFLRRQPAWNRVEDRETRRPEPRPLAWLGPAALSPRPASTVKPSGVAPSALPPDPCCRLFTAVACGSASVECLLDLVVSGGGDPQQGNHVGFSGCPGRQTQRALAGDQALLWPRFWTFHICLYGLRKVKGKGSQLGGVCARVHERVNPSL